MDWKDLLLAGAIIGGCLYLLYRSVWKKGGFCPGCSSGSCPGKGDNNRPQSKGAEL